MRDPVSLRSIPTDALHLAHALSTQTGLSLSALFRLALVSGLLVECTKVGPDAQGQYAGREAAWLAKALRRHLGSAIDLLLEQGQHPLLALAAATEMSSGHVLTQALASSQQHWQSHEATEGQRTFEQALQDDLEQLGIGLGLSALHSRVKEGESDE